jgi:hypothetical protein
VEVALDVRHEAIEEVDEEFGLQVADMDYFDEVFVDEGGTTAEVDGGDGESFIHGLDEVAGAVDAFTIAEGLAEELAKDDTDIFDGVVLVDIEVTGCFEVEVKAAMLGEELEHVVEEADACRDGVLAFAFDLEGALDLGFFGDSFNFGGAH